MRVMTGILKTVLSVIENIRARMIFGWYAANTCYTSHPVPIMLMLFNDFEGNAMNVLHIAFS